LGLAWAAVTPLLLVVARRLEAPPAAALAS